MRRHEFEPGLLVAGLVFIALAAGYLLDASGTWDVTWRDAAPAAGAGLAVAWLASGVNRLVRERAHRRRLGGAAPDGGTDGGTDDPARDGKGPVTGSTS